MLSKACSAISRCAATCRSDASVSLGMARATTSVSRGRTDNEVSPSGFFIQLSLRARCLTRRNDPCPFPPIDIDDQQQPLGQGIANDELTCLVLRGRITSQIEGIEKDFRRFFKRHTMIGNVAARFLFVPLELDPLELVDDVHASIVHGLRIEG